MTPLYSAPLSRIRPSSSGFKSLHAARIDRCRPDTALVNLELSVSMELAIRAVWLLPSSTPQTRLDDIVRRLMQMLNIGPPTISVVMITRTASRPEVVVIIDGKATAAQYRAARHRPHTITVSTADTSDMIADNGILQCKHDVMYSIISRPTSIPAVTAINH